MCCMEYRWRTMKPRKGWICPYRAKDELCSVVEHVLLRENDEELSWSQMGRDLEKNIELTMQRMAREAAGEKTVHKMTLRLPHFDAVEQGIKTVEMRLDDAKRRWIRKGDLIEFSCVGEKERTLYVEVTNKTPFLDFEELAENYDARALGFEGYDSVEIGEYMRSLYDVQKLKACHVVAIEFVKYKDK